MRGFAALTYFAVGGIFCIGWISNLSEGGEPAHRTALFAAMFAMWAMARIEIMKSRD